MAGAKKKKASAKNKTQVKAGNIYQYTPPLFYKPLIIQFQTKPNNSK
jgi:hypothetical protein